MDFVDCTNVPGVILCRDQGAEGAPASQGQPLIPAEEVVSRSGLGAQVITSFLFEHYVHMIAPEAIEDAAASAEMFSDAIFMLGRGSNDTGTFGAHRCSSLLSLNISLVLELCFLMFALLTEAGSL